MGSLSVGDYQRILELATESLRSAGPGFPDAAVTELIRDAFQADFAGVGKIDFHGTTSRPSADSPHPISWSAGGFHEYATRHPLALAYRHTGKSVPLRLSDVTATSKAMPAYDGTNLSRVLTIPLKITPGQLCAIGILRGGPNFTTRDLQVACQLQPVLSGIYALRGRLAQQLPSRGGQDSDSRLTSRELAVLSLMADGLIAVAVARRLNISLRTVNKHIEHIYEKLGTHDRTSTILRAEALGLLIDKH